MESMEGMEDIEALESNALNIYEALMPNELNIYYANTNGKLIYAMGADVQPVRDTLDRIAGSAMGFDQAAGYDKITRALTLKNNFLFAISLSRRLNVP